MGGESIDMYRSVDVLNDMVHELLPKGLSASANMYHVKNNSPLNFITDMTGYNLYYGWYYGKIKGLDEWIDQFHLDNPQVALGISEYGADTNLSFHSELPKVKDYSEEFQSIYHEETYAIIKSKPYLWGSFVWNMFDFGSVIRNEGGTRGKNCKGLVTFDRLIKKDAFYFYKANWSLEPFIHICEKRYVNRDKEKIDVRIYSNLSKISLTVNGLDAGTVEGEQVFIFREVPLKPGHNVVRAYNADHEDVTTFIKADQPDESYVFVDPHPEINVINWFTQEQGEIDLFPENYYSIMDSLGALMENEEAWAVVREFAPKIVERAIPGAVTLLWVCNKMKSVLAEEEVKAMNNRLIKIKKVKN
jgi:beta-galactosidase